MYRRLVGFLIDNLDLHEGFVILEAGCGRGRLTIPFTRKVKEIMEDFKIIAFDLSAGPYKGDLDVLKQNVMKEELEKFIVTVNGDVRKIVNLKNESVDLIISNELLCELDREGLKKALKEFYRILKPNGQMAHGELNPVPENVAQKLVIEANLYSLETSKPKTEWFSPFSDEVITLMHKLGFEDLVVKYFETEVKFSFKEAIEQLRKWNTNPAFIKMHMNELKKYGLEYPIEHVIFCKKPQM
jgi:ubiquinone/menaquinone biosynthesis C-methylase UbiE